MKKSISFILAATWEHKNHVLLLKAINYLNFSQNFRIKLFCTGHQTQHNVFLENTAKELEIDDLYVHLGVVEELELFSLYQSAQLVVVPTLYEAGSFPLMESMLMGIPVICSNVTSLPETIGNSHFVFDPHDHEKLGQLIIEMLTHPEARKNNIENSMKMSNRLLSNNSLDIIDSIYSELSESVKLQQD
ncbi:MAG: glycosyltransferase [Chitinophagales bacterium]